MSPADKTSNKSKPLSIALALVLLVAAGWIAFAPDKPRAVEQVYFFDLGTGKLYAASSKELPPTTAPSGEKGAWAYVFSCGNCADESSRKIAYLMTYTPQYKQAMLAGGDDIPTHDGTLLRAADGGDWIAQGSAAGQQIVAETRTLCGNDSKPITCIP